MVADKTLYHGPWFVYIAECRDKTLYVGIAKDTEKRIDEHNNTSKCRYTCFRKPLRLVYREICDNYNKARKREKEAKKFSRAKKFKLIDSCSL